MSNQRIRIIVTGKVQGVFFRQSLKIKAKKNEIFGWVKNLKDGRVEAILEGDEEKINELLEKLASLPKLNSWDAKVEELSILEEIIPIKNHHVTTKNVDDFNWSPGVEFYL